jgi:hypothetical protein
MRGLLALFAALTVAWFGIVPAAAQNFPGVSGTRYVSPQFGYELQWDDSWQAERSLSRPGFDALALSNGTSYVVLATATGDAAATGFVASPEQCVQQALSAIIVQPGTQPVLREDASGAPSQGNEDGLVWLEFNYAAFDGSLMVAYVSCEDIGLGDGAMQTLIHSAPERDYDAEVIAVDALLAGYEAPRFDLDQLDPAA